MQIAISRFVHSLPAKLQLNFCQIQLWVFPASSGMETKFRNPADWFLKRKDLLDLHSEVKNKVWRKWLSENFRFKSVFGRESLLSIFAILITNKIYAYTRYDCPILYNYIYTALHILIHNFKTVILLTSLLVVRWWFKGTLTSLLSLKIFICWNEITYWSPFLKGLGHKIEFKYVDKNV